MRAAAAGGVGFTKTAAEKVAWFDITMNPICPNAATAKVAGVPPDKLAQFTAAITVGRLAAPDEGAPAVSTSLPVQRQARSPVPCRCHRFACTARCFRSLSGTRVQ
jgi:NAD(P)-dependent dehydrogenase (short-subunit alcohol dehydrogenase family)